jgi:ABC-type uncharacterized transport system ATPase subunit
MSLLQPGNISRSFGSIQVPDERSLKLPTGEILGAYGRTGQWQVGPRRQ